MNGYTCHTGYVPERSAGSRGLVLADFYSDSCIPCKRLSPVLAELEEAYGDALKVAKININFDLPLAEQYEVQAVPTLIFLPKTEQSRTDAEVWSKKAELQEIIDSLEITHKGV
mgnify:CR=1 FL=1